MPGHQPDKRPNAEQHAAAKKKVSNTSEISIGKCQSLLVFVCLLINQDMRYFKSLADYSVISYIIKRGRTKSLNLEEKKNEFRGL